MPKSSNFEYDWADLAFANKKPLKDLHAIFIAAPREISSVRFTQLIKEYLPQGNMVLGLAKEPYIDGFDGQLQFRTLQHTPGLQKIIDRVNASATSHKLFIMRYFQREAQYILEKCGFHKVLLVNGSWRFAFHNRPEYYALVAKNIDYRFVSPFIDEAEAREYEAVMAKELRDPAGAGATLEISRDNLTEDELLDVATRAARLSYDYNFQTGSALAKKVSSSARHYKFILSTFNPVVPFQTYAMHYGASRERNLSPPHDQNYYDTVHAEVMMLLEAQRRKIDLKGTALFINLMPCPACARMLSQTDIEEFVYMIDHSDGYAVQMLEAAGKKVRRVVPRPQPAL